MELPGSPRLHVWLGILLSLVGVGVAGYAYTGDRAYEIKFVGVAFLGFALLLVGSVLTGWGQANRPRMGGRKAARKKKADEQAADQEETEPDQAEPDEAKEETPGVLARARAWVAAIGAPDEVTATVACSDCGHVFTATGQPPFQATCPSCGHEDTVHTPKAVETQPRPRIEVRGQPVRSRGEQVEPARAERPPGGDRMSRLQRLKKQVTRPGTTSLTLACSHCDHVFTAQGQLPFEVACPHCGYQGVIESTPR